MANFTGGNDEQLAAGAAIGGSAQILGTTATGVAKYVAVKCGALGAMKTGILGTLALNPILGTLAAIGGIGYLLHKKLKK